MRVLILANGAAPSAKTASAAAGKHDTLIATDGAAYKAAAMGLTPDIICGDFDSMDFDLARQEFPAAEFVALPDQNLADLEKAINLAMERGATSVTVLGWNGGRVDHSLTSFALLHRFHSELEISLEDDDSVVRSISGTPGHTGRLTIATQPQDTISLIAFSKAENVSISGVSFPLEHASLPVGTHGVSNVATADSVSIEIGEGSVLVCHIWSR